MAVAAPHPKPLSQKFDKRRIAVDLANPSPAEREQSLCAVGPAWPALLDVLISAVAASANF
jgi:hypothetical protein